MVMKKGLFSPAKDKRLAKIITIKSPTAFKESIRKLKKGGLTLKEKRGLVLARNRAAAQLKRKNLSSEERVQFRKIKNIKLPAITKRQRK